MLLFRLHLTDLLTLSTFFHILSLILVQCEQTNKSSQVQQLRGQRCDNGWTIFPPKTITIYVVKPSQTLVQGFRVY